MNNLVPNSIIQACDIPNDYMDTDYYHVLDWLVKAKQPRRILEIGTRFGYSMAIMLHACPGITHAYSFDTTATPASGEWHGGIPRAYATGQANLYRLKAEGSWPALEALQCFDFDTQALSLLPLQRESIDLAYIDGDHTFKGCKHDLELVLPYMKDGGMIIGDDADHCKLRATIEDFAAYYWFPSVYIPDTAKRGRVAVIVQR